VDATDVAIDVYTKDAVKVGLVVGLVGVVVVPIITVVGTYTLFVVLC